MCLCNHVFVSVFVLFVLLFVCFAYVCLFVFRIDMF